MIIHSEKDSCVYNQLESNSSYYNLPIKVTQSYILTDLCEGYVTEITLYTYSSGHVALMFHKVKKGETSRTLLGSFFGVMYSNRSSTMTITQNKPFYISEGLEITIYSINSLSPIL